MKKDYENKINELIGLMTLSEKVGQLQQCGPSLVGAFDVSFEELLNMMFDGRISHEEFERLMGSATQDYHEEDLKAGKIGSYNGIGDAETVNRLQKIAVEETRLGIPLLFGFDVIHGFKTVTPIPLAESCAWDPDLWERTGRMAAKEAAAGGVHMTFAPMVDVAKDARWGRISEGAGEDVLLNGAYGEAKVKGFQGEDIADSESVIACVKHFAAYGAAEAGRDYNRVDMSVQRLYEEYLPSYEKCIKAGARAIMPAFNDINGVPCSVNKWLLNDILREKWGFNGVTVSDSNAIAECINHGIAADKKEASKKALAAGMDIDMSSNSYIESLEELISSGELDEAVLDRAVADVLRVKFELGLFDNPYKTCKEREESAMLTKENRELAYEAAVKSLVLLKNNKDEDGKALLPLEKGTKIALFGELAGNRGEMTGAWAVGTDPDSCVSLIDACENKGIDYVKGDGDNVEEAAAGASVLIAAIGESKDESGEAASRADISLKEKDIDLLKSLALTGKPVIVILFNGRPLAIPYAAENAAAILEAWQLGCEAGNAVIDALFGTVNPQGKLTTTFPYATGQCPMYYAHINTGRPGGKSKFTSKYLDTPLEPLYPFGYGLSYTEYSYENIKAYFDNNKVSVEFEVKNVGERDGAEIAQVYIGGHPAERVRPVKKLAAFKRVPLKAGESKRVTLTVDKDEFGYYDYDMKFRIDDGMYTLYVGRDSKDAEGISVELK